VDYSGTSANYIPKMSDTNTITNSVIYESGGNVGIGTTSPADSLDVNGDIRVRGGDIKDSGGTARITFSGTNIILSLG
ncbi:MAG: hypothetical protein PWR32_645, partial [Candidatus Woesearchaeota archaeon]|nr:hypothetical protein [Candidatus Woesearchaeota archaeon]